MKPMKGIELLAILEKFALSEGGIDSAIWIFLFDT
jgi:hypothetical protein